MVNASLNLFAGSSPATSQLTTNQGETMTLTVQDLVTKLREFATDAIVRIRADYGVFPTYVVRNISSIEKDNKGDVVLIAEIPSNPYNDHEESEDEESEDEE